MLYAVVVVVILLLIQAILPKIARYLLIMCLLPVLSPWLPFYKDFANIKDGLFVSLRIEMKPEQISLLKRLAQDGIVKPPSIETAHSGLNYFMFTPTPSKVHLSPTKRDIYEKAMAIVAAIRQGQLLPQHFPNNMQFDHRVPCFISLKTNFD